MLTNACWYRLFITRSSEIVFQLQLSSIGARKIRPLGQKVEEKAPVVESGLKDQSVEEGSDCTLEVKYSGEPSPTIEWKKNGKELNIGRRIEVTSKEGLIMLRILSIRKSDSGEYTVILTNKHGSESSKAKISIKSDGTY